MGGGKPKEAATATAPKVDKKKEPQAQGGSASGDKKKVPVQAKPGEKKPTSSAATKPEDGKPKPSAPTKPEDKKSKPASTAAEGEKPK